MEQMLLGPLVICAMICGYMLNEFQRYIQWKKIEEEKEREELAKLKTNE